MPTSLADIAARAGVSPGTVSCVLNEKTEARIALATQERVRRVAREMGYQPNRMARSLRMGRTGTIGLMVSRLTNPFFATLAQAVEMSARSADWEVLIDADYENHAPGDVKGKLRGWPVDGVIIWTLPYMDASDFLGDDVYTRPLVYLGYERARRESASHVIALDFYGGARAMMAHLIARGKRRIAYLALSADEHFQAADPKVRGYRDACAEAGIEPYVVAAESTPSLMPITGVRTAGFEIARAIARAPRATRPDALFCACDMLAISAYNGARRAGLSVPGDLAIAGFDGIEDGECLAQILTTVVHPVEEMSARAVGVLKDQLAGNLASRGQDVVLPFQIRCGETT